MLFQAPGSVVTGSSNEGTLPLHAQVLGTSWTDRKTRRKRGKVNGAQGKKCTSICRVLQRRPDTRAVISKNFLL